MVGKCRQAGSRGFKKLYNMASVVEERLYLIFNWRSSPLLRLCITAISFGMMLIGDTEVCSLTERCSREGMARNVRTCHVRVSSEELAMFLQSTVQGQFS